MRITCVVCGASGEMDDELYHQSLAALREAHKQHVGPEVEMGGTYFVCPKCKHDSPTAAAKMVQADVARLHGRHRDN